MILAYVPGIARGLYTSLTLTTAALLIALTLSLIFAVILTLKVAVIEYLINIYIVLFTGTPMLIQIFLIYYGPGQFALVRETPWLWQLLSQPWLCAVIALALNSTAYTTQLFYGAIRAISGEQWRACAALGMSKAQALTLLLPCALKRALSAYSNEVVLIFKSTSLAYTITLMEIMGYSQLLYGRTYDVGVFIAAGIIYLSINGLLTLLIRFVEHRALAFERRN